MEKSIENIKKKRLTDSIGNILSLILILLMVFGLITTVHNHIQGEEPEIFGYRFYYVASGSMSPTIPVGSLIVVRETAFTDIQSKDIITFKGIENTLVTHRVTKTSKNGQSLTTRGDANNVEDTLPVTAEKLVGKVMFHIPYLGYLLVYFKSIYGAGIVIAIMLLGWIIHFVLPRKKKNK